MEDRETIDRMNKELREYGIETVTGLSMWRIVWAEDQLEKRFTNYTEAGIELIHPMVLELPKYPHLKGKYILEHLIGLSDSDQKELAGSGKISYECAWTFMNKRQEYMPPNMWLARFIIDSVNAAHGQGDLVKYKDPDSIPEEARERHKQEIDNLYEELFGNENDVTDALAYHEGISVPHNYGDK